jgi:chloramphenicol 3-O phosphotransferase
VATQVIVLNGGSSSGKSGMAAAQAVLVRRGVAYDMQVDTTHTEALDRARAIAALVQ